jgi:hypothetical protein
MSEAWAQAVVAEPRPGDEELDPPFAVREGKHLWDVYRHTWWLVAWKPGRFFARAKIDRSGTAVVFGFVSATLGLFVSSFYSAFNWRHWIDLSKDLPRAERSGVYHQVLPFLATGFSLAEALTAPVKVLFGLVFGAMWIHVALLLLRAGSRTFDATLTVVGYAFGLGALLALPVCGFPLVAAWMAIVLVLGVAAAQRCSLGKSAVAVLTPGLLVLVFGFRPWLQGMFALVKTLQGGVP